MLQEELGGFATDRIFVDSLNVVVGLFAEGSEWVGLLEKHPDLYELAKQYEKLDPDGGERFTWSQRESLEELSRPERVAEIKRNLQKAIEKEKARRRVSLPLFEVLNDVLDDENDEEPCFFCQT